MSLFKYFLVAAVACGLLSACKTLEIDVVQTPQHIIPTLPVSPIQRPTWATSALTPTPDVNAYAATPQEGTLYLGNVAGEAAMFLRSRGFFANPYLGAVWYFERGRLPFEPVEYLTQGTVAADLPFDFRNFSQPQAISAYGPEIGRVTDVKRSAKLISNNLPQPEKDFLYVALVDQVIEDDLVTNMPWRAIWHPDPSQDYSKSSWDIAIDQTAGPLQAGGDRYLVLSLESCCEPFPPYDKIVLNAKTGKDLYLGKVGNVHIDYIQDIVSYQHLSSLRQKCEPSPICEADGYMTLYAPSGELLKQPLP